MGDSQVANDVTAPDCPYTGPGCTFGLDYAFRQCYNLIKPGVFDLNAKSRVALCIFDRVNQFEQAVLNTNQYILTLWPAIVGIIGGFGHSAEDVVCDSVWWSISLAITSAGLPGFIRMQPPHHLIAESFEQGEALCKHWEYSCERPRIIAKHKSSKIFAPARSAAALEAFMFLSSITLYIAFNYFFIAALTPVIVFGRSTPYIAGCWYWLSASPMALLLFAEILQDRVELYEPQLQQVTASLPVEQKDSHQLLSHELNPIDRFVRVPLTRQTTSLSFAKVSKFTLPFVSKWARIFRHQLQGTQYRLLIRPASQRWCYQVWQLLVGLYRVTLFTVGCVQMGNIVLFPPGAAIDITIALLVGASALPRFAFLSLCDSSPRGADLIVKIHPIDLHNVLPTS